MPLPAYATAPTVDELAPIVARVTALEAKTPDLSAYAKTDDVAKAIALKTDTTVFETESARAKAAEKVGADAIAALWQSAQSDPVEGELVNKIFLKTTKNSVAWTVTTRLFLRDIEGLIEWDSRTYPLPIGDPTAAVPVGSGQLRNQIAPDTAVTYQTDKTIKANLALTCPDGLYSELVITAFDILGAIVSSYSKRATLPSTSAGALVRMGVPPVEVASIRIELIYQDASRIPSSVVYTYQLA